MNRWLIVIPARLASTRLENKPLQDLAGKPLIVRVFENLSPLFDGGAKIVVATDSTEVSTVCKRHNVPFILTSPDHPSGTDRCNEVANAHDKEFILNVQGDEPFVKVQDLKSLMDLLESGKFKMGTVVHQSSNMEEFKDPNKVKVALTANMKALYFSRSPIPSNSRIKCSEFKYWQHVGIYAYEKSTLKTICDLNPSSLETIESLEQLRALENNIDIGAIESEHPTIGIDTKSDLEKARELYS